MKELTALQKSQVASLLETLNFYQQLPVDVRKRVVSAVKQVRFAAEELGEALNTTTQLNSTVLVSTLDLTSVIALI